MHVIWNLDFRKRFFFLICSLHCLCFQVIEYRYWQSDFVDIQAYGYHCNLFFSVELDYENTHILVIEIFVSLTQCDQHNKKMKITLSRQSKKKTKKQIVWSSIKTVYTHARCCSTYKISDSTTFCNTLNSKIKTALRIFHKLCHSPFFITIY